MKKRKLFKKLSEKIIFKKSYFILKNNIIFLYLYIFKKGDDLKLNICIKI